MGRHIGLQKAPHFYIKAAVNEANDTVGNRQGCGCVLVLMLISQSKIFKSIGIEIFFQRSTYLCLLVRKSQNVTRVLGLLLKRNCHFSRIMPK